MLSDVWVVLSVVWVVLSDVWVVSIGVAGCVGGVGRCGAFGSSAISGNGPEKTTGSLKAETPFCAVLWSEEGKRIGP